MTPVDENDKPYCVRCGKPVEHMLLEPDKDFAVFTITFECHGETETARVSYETLTFIRPFEGRLVFREAA